MSARVNYDDVLSLADGLKELHATYPGGTFDIERKSNYDLSVSATEPNWYYEVLINWEEEV